MKKIIILMIIAVSGLIYAAELPNIHATIMLDSKFYSGDNDNQGNYNSDNRIQVRKAALNFSGLLEEKIRYAIEMGVSTCTGSGDTFRLMEAEIFYNAFDNFQFGIKQGHIMRGFSFYTECSQRLTMEKPYFQKTFAACHPMGLVGEGYVSLPSEFGLQYEAGLLNGVNGTFNKEHDYNLGLMLSTPVPGIMLAGSYSMTAQQYFDENYQKYSEDGHRFGSGIEFHNSNIWLTAEYYAGKGFSYDDQEMTAYYAQAGYKVDIPLKNIEAVEPWTKFEVWDKDADNNEESEYTYFDAGVNIYLTPSTRLKAAYATITDQPDDAAKAPDSFIIRLQTEF